MTAGAMSHVLALMAGFALGMLHFGSLWWVVRRLPASPRPMPWLVASTAVRFAVTLSVLFLVLQSGVLDLALCLLGFVVARTLLTAVSGLRRARG